MALAIHTVQMTRHCVSPNGSSVPKPNTPPARRHGTREQARQPAAARRLAERQVQKGPPARTLDLMLKGYVADTALDSITQYVSLVLGQCLRVLQDDGHSNLPTENMNEIVRETRR